jgi:hypothetical protein
MYLDPPPRSLYVCSHIGRTFRIAVFAFSGLDCNGAGGLEFSHTLPNVHAQRLFTGLIERQSLSKSCPESTSTAVEVLRFG